MNSSARCSRLNSPYALLVPERSLTSTPFVPGHEAVGVVEQIGPEVTRYAVGDEVFGFLLHANPTVHDGSWAELIAVPQDMFIGRAPQGVDLATAGSAPLAGIQPCCSSRISAG